MREDRITEAANFIDNHEWTWTELGPSLGEQIAAALADAGLLATIPEWSGRPGNSTRNICQAYKDAEGGLVERRWVTPWEEVDDAA